MQKLALLFFLTLAVNSCIHDPNGYFKKSANNKIFDMKGFNGGKRKPIYNQKYISQAKHNIAKGQAEELEELDENEPWINATPAHSNYAMYEKMIIDDLKSRQKNSPKNSKPIVKGLPTAPPYHAYPSAAGAETRLDSNTEIELIRDELAELRAELTKAKSQLEKNQKKSATAKPSKTQAPSKTADSSKTKEPTPKLKKTTTKTKNYKDDIDEQAVKEI